MQQDELAALFHQSLNFSNTPPPPPPQQLQEEEHQDAAPQPITYISQHYHHSTHIPRARSEPATTPPSERSAAELQAIFDRNDIDTHDLSPGQLELFARANDDQKLRLLELWRITLPKSADAGPSQAALDGVWTAATSLEQEEQLARQRYERMEYERHLKRAPPINTALLQLQQQEMDMVDDDGTTASSPTSVAEPAQHALAEPYILSGYEALAKRDYDSQAAACTPATDPVYKAAVENQYGAFQAMREYEGSMGWFDDEMVM